MEYDFHELNERVRRLPSPERLLMQVAVDALRARSCFQDHGCSLEALAAATNDALVGARSEPFANFARRISISIENELAALWDEMRHCVIVEGEYKEVDPEPPASLCPESSNEGLTQ